MPSCSVASTGQIGRRWSFFTARSMHSDSTWRDVWVILISTWRMRWATARQSDGRNTIHNMRLAMRAVWRKWVGLEKNLEFQQLERIERSDGPSALTSSARASWSWWLLRQVCACTISKPASSKSVWSWPSGQVLLWGIHIEMRCLIHADQCIVTTRKDVSHEDLIEPRHRIEGRRIPTEPWEDLLREASVDIFQSTFQAKNVLRVTAASMYVTFGVKFVNAPILDLVQTLLFCSTCYDRASAIIDNAV